MRAGSGAIEKVSIADDGSVELSVIADAQPLGICGSGLLDILAELYIHEIIDRIGRLIPDANPKVRKGPEGLEFELAPASDGCGQIVITQADINNLIRSKAGIFAAIRVLMHSTQVEAEDIDAVYLAGGFGNFLNTKQAVVVGMLPQVPAEKIHFVGNTAIAGAKSVLLSHKALDTAEQIAKNMTYFDLMTHPEYMEEFIRASFLPHTDLSLFPAVK